MHLFKVYKQGKYGFINDRGDLVIPFKFERVFPFSEGLAWASIDQGNGENLSGFIDKKGEWVIEPQFSAEPPSRAYEIVPEYLFSQGIAPVKNRENKYFFIDKQGNPITEAIYDGARSFSDGMAAVMRNDKIGYIDATGKEVIPCQYWLNWPVMWGRYDFYEGFAAVRFGPAKEDPLCEDICESEYKNMNFINKEGKELLKERILSCSYFNEGVALYRPEKVNSYYVIGDYCIDKNGNVPFNRRLLTGFSEGLAVAADEEELGYVDKKGAWVLEPQFREAQKFSEGLACVNTWDNAMTGFINKEGEFVIPQKFKSLGYFQFKNGLAWVEEEDGKISGYINTKGEYIWKEA